MGPFEANRINHPLARSHRYRCVLVASTKLLLARTEESLLTFAYVYWTHQLRASLSHSREASSPFVVATNCPCFDPQENELLIRGSDEPTRCRYRKRSPSSNGPKASQDIICCSLCLRFAASYTPTSVGCSAPGPPSHWTTFSVSSLCHGCV